MGESWQLRAAVLLLILCAFPFKGFAAPSFHLIPQAAGEDGDPTMRALSGDGLVAVGGSQIYGPALVWSKTAGSSLVHRDPPFQAHLTVAQAVSADGSVIVGAGQVGLPSQNTGQFEVFRWTEADGMESLGTISPFHLGSPLVITASAVSDDGSVIVGGAGKDEGQEAFLWTRAGGMKGLGDLPGGDLDSQILAMSADGSKLVGTATGESGSQAAVAWTAESGFALLGGITSDALKSRATAVSPDGDFIVGWARHLEGDTAFRSAPDTPPVSLGDLPGGGSFSAASGVSADGNVVVGLSSGYLDRWEGFIWDPVRGMRPLTDVLAHDYGLGESLPTFVGSVQGISRDGKVILGQTWIADLRDEPIPGDANFDGQVDLSDFGILKDHFGSGRYRDEGDFTADGKVTLSDFGVLKAGFGQAGIIVPEPTTLLLLLTGAIAFAGRVLHVHAHRRRQDVIVTVHGVRVHGIENRGNRSTAVVFVAPENLSTNACPIPCRIETLRAPAFTRPHKRCLFSGVPRV